MKKPEIVFATNNTHKLREMRQLLDGAYRVLSLADIDCHDDIPETSDTLRGNAMIKARWVKDHYGYDCFADDTGLMVDALDGEPGVYSARYAGPSHDSQANMRLLLQRMQPHTDRRAHFSTVIVLIQGYKTVEFEGRVDGHILLEPQGNEGFGYDPIFLPEGYDISFAQMNQEQKNAISHRGRAAAQLLEYLIKNTI